MVSIVTAAAQTLREVLPQDVVLSYTRGLIFTLSTRGEPARTSSVQLPMTALTVPGPLTQKLERAYQAHADVLQQLIAELTETDWPTAHSTPHVAVTVEDIRVRWTGLDPRRKRVELAPIPRSDIS